MMYDVCELLRRSQHADDATESVTNYPPRSVMEARCDLSIFVDLLLWMKEGGSLVHSPSPSRKPV